MDTGTDTGAYEAPAHADGGPGCGSVLTESTRLTEDLGFCLGDGLVLGANGITLDCDGHELQGTIFWGGRGVVVDGVSGVTVKNCVIDGFEWDIYAHDSIGSTFRDNELTGNDNINVGNGCMLLEGVTSSRIADNDIYGCFDLVRVRDSYALTIEENLLRGGFGGVILTGVNEGHRVRANHADRVFGFGSEAAFVLLDQAVGNRFDENHIEGGGVGIRLTGDGVRGNLIENNRVEDSNLDGIRITGGSENVFRYNRVEDNGLAAFYGEESGFHIDGGHRNLFRGNHADDNGGSGFYVEGDARDHVFDGNEACGNGDLDAILDPSATGTRWFDNDFCTEGGL